MTKKSWTSLLHATSGDIRRASSTWRYSSIPVCQYENLMEHTGYVAAFGAMIAQQLYGIHAPVIGAVLMKAVTHDLDECVTGDVVRTFKYSDQALKKEIDRAGAALVSQMEPETQDLFSAADEMIRLSGDPDGVKAIVKAADFVSLFQYMRREAALHNFEIIPYFARMVVDLQSMASAAGRGELAGLYSAMASEAGMIAESCFGEAYHSDYWRRRVKAPTKKAGGRKK